MKLSGAREHEVGSVRIGLNRAWSSSKRPRTTGGELKIEKAETMETSPIKKNHWNVGD